MNVFSIGLMGYATSLVGFVLAFVSSLYTNKTGKRFQGVLSGFTGGVLIAFVCFGLLPRVFENDGLFYGIVGIIAGACVAMFIESAVPERGAVIAVGVALHSIPEGIALGSVLGTNLAVGLSMCPVIALHCFPEALAVVMPIKKSGTGPGKIFVTCFLLALPMGVSSLVGAALSNVSQVFVSLCAAFAGGVIIYITCGEIIPGSKKMWNGRLTALGAVFGFVTGVLLTSF